MPRAETLLLGFRERAVANGDHYCYEASAKRKALASRYQISVFKTVALLMRLLRDLQVDRVE